MFSNAKRDRLKVRNTLKQVHMGMPGRNNGLMDEGQELGITFEALDRKRTKLTNEWVMASPTGVRGEVGHLVAEGLLFSEEAFGHMSWFSMALDPAYGDRGRSTMLQGRMHRLPEISI